MAAPTIVSSDKLTAILRDTIIGTVRRDGPDLSARQLAVLLICYLEPGPHTVRGLAARLDVSKPAITRSLDRLGELNLARRLPDPSDRRSVLVSRTRDGNSYMTAVRHLLNEAARAKPTESEKREKKAGATG